MDANVKAGQNPEEPFDVVDEQDRVIGRAPRREVHARRLRHRSIHVLVFDQAGRVFLQKRSQAKDSCPGLWDSSCSGHLDAGEDYDDAATRELREEIGLVPPAPPARWLRLEASERTGWEFVWVYRLRSEGPFVLDPAEIESGAWFAPAEVDAGLHDRPEEFAGAFRYLWPLVRAKRS
ncbi:MAG TPA: NUDIX domain-containing protein [Opitutaceae bacterium]|nr:NUDIX domain-containing protein [Opitutaceae bacterium]